MTKNSQINLFEGNLFLREDPKSLCPEKIISTKSTKFLFESESSPETLYESLIFIISISEAIMKNKLE